MPMTAADPDGRLAGAPGPQALLRRVVADPEGARLVDVVAPGGFGKSVLLAALAEAWERAGVPVVDAPGPGAAVVVDDAHRLDADALARLAEHAREPGARVVVAHRPHPRPPALAALGALLAARGRPLVLDALDGAGVRARAARLVPDQPVDTELVLRLTGGVPALVDRLLPAAPTAGELPPGLLAQVGYALDALDPGVAALLLARAVGAPTDAEVLVPLLGLPDAGAADELVQLAVAGGHLLAGGRPIPLVDAAVLARTPPAAVTEARRALAEIELERGGDAGAAARALAAAGATGRAVAEVLAAAGDRAVRDGTGSAEELYAAAVRAGTPALLLAARRAEAAAVAGELDTASAHADTVLAALEDDPDAVPRRDGRRAAAAAAAVLARRGNLARSADTARFAVAELGADAAVAVPALVGTGALDEARAVLAPGARRRAPTLQSGAVELIAQGVVESVTGSPTSAMSKLVRAAGLIEPPHRAALLPDSPAALAALVAVQCGELAVAQSVLDRAVAVGLGGCGAAARHRLLLGWIAAYRGTLPAARAVLTEVGSGLEPRDELLAAGLEVALARRTGDRAALALGWTRARAAIVHHPVDLFVLPILAELRVAAARLREQSWVAPHLEEARALLHALGDPLLWAAPLHWAGVHAAMFADTPAAAAPDVAALEAGASTSRYAAAMAEGARQWLRVLGGDVDAPAVESAARGLHAVGLSWDGGRLAGQAAIRTRDKAAMSALLGAARALQQGPSPVAPTDAPEEPAATDQPLSEREQEVAVLVLEGLTYKQIGERLFISAKTVEHHVARMRQRLGSGSRGDLFAQLRAIVGQQAGA
jgi:DNA-binding CsgD family transcriptional regulator